MTSLDDLLPIDPGKDKAAVEIAYGSDALQQFMGCLQQDNREEWFYWAVCGASGSCVALRS